MAETLSVMLCCNDEHGNFTGFVDCIELEETRLYYLDLETIEPVGLRVEFGQKNAFWGVPRPLWLPYSRHKKHVGSLLWDSIDMYPKYVAELFELARRFGFAMTQGEAEIFKAWHAKQPITEQLIRGAVHE